MRLLLPERRGEVEARGAWVKLDVKGVTLVKNRQILHQIKNPKNDPSKNDPSKNPPKKPWHFFRFLAACCAPPPKIEKNASMFLAFFPIFGGVLRTAAKNRKKCSDVFGIFSDFWRRAATSKNAKRHQLKNRRVLDWFLTKVTPFNSFAIHLICKSKAVAAASAAAIVVTTAEALTKREQQQKQQLQSLLPPELATLDTP